MVSLNQYTSQEKEEHTILVIHRHWFNIFQQFLIVILMAIVLLGGFFLFPRLFPLLQDPEVEKIFVFGENTLVIFMWLYSFFIWIEYYFDIWVITDKKIIDTEQASLFIRRISELKLEKIQDITVEVKGMLPTVLNYGNIYIQTAGEVERFVFNNIPDPYGVKNLIMNLQKETIREETDELGEIIRKEIHS